MLFDDISQLAHRNYPTFQLIAQIKHFPELFNKFLVRSRHSETWSFNTFGLSEVSQTHTQDAKLTWTDQNITSLLLSSAALKRPRFYLGLRLWSKSPRRANSLRSRVAVLYLSAPNGRHKSESLRRGIKKKKDFCLKLKSGFYKKWGWELKIQEIEACVITKD